MSNIVSKFLHTRLRVNDLDKTLEFYGLVFGLSVTRRHESPRGSKLAFLAVPNSEEEIEITFYPGSGPVEVQEDLMHLAFEVESMEKFEEHLQSVGYQFSDGPTQSSSGSIFAFVDAPEGYEIEVIERPR
ncbi:MAG TPA: glyoxalase [Opitutae bacterium]|nr:glyoxalase [Opitutae bacterium]HCY59018.1 glyoxalase [Opitutae bacterium]|tara:strand:- start:3033 stop:3422 length:390 start_codon:yes stop_codon:yes gene_type:complete